MSGVMGRQHLLQATSLCIQTATIMAGRVTDGRGYVAGPSSLNIRLRYSEHDRMKFHAKLSQFRTRPQSGDQWEFAKLANNQEN